MEKYSIENKFLKISVLETGAELCSIINKKTGREYLWQADPGIWGSHAPNLFPVIGVMKDGKYTFEGREYEMPKHGFIRHNSSIRLKERSEDQMVFELLYSEDTLKMYPFKFDFKITFKLQEKSLEVSHKIINLDKSAMYFSIGGHPAFNIQFSESEKVEDYFLKFDQKMDLQTYLLNEGGLVSSKTEGVLDNENTLRLDRHIFDRDALIFKSIPSKKVSLESKAEGKILSLNYLDFNNLGIWAKPGAPYVCIEPWLGIADVEDTDQKLENKEGIICLEAQNEFKCSYFIDIA